MGPGGPWAWCPGVFGTWARVKLTVEEAGCPHTLGALRMVAARPSRPSRPIEMDMHHGGQAATVSGQVPSTPPPEAQTCHPEMLFGRCVILHKGPGPSNQG